LKATSINPVEMVHLSETFINYIVCILVSIGCFAYESLLWRFS
jgi:hypothetical protein